MEMHDNQGTLGSYLFGFIASVVLTFAAYFLVVKQTLSGWTLIFAIVFLGIVQAIIQLILFLYLGKEEKPRSKLLVFIFMILVLSMIVGGSLWIMYSLNERVMPPMNGGM